jgi:hypothetical protein
MSKPRRQSAPLTLLLLCSALAVLIIVWCVYWFLALSQSKHEVARRIEALRSDGLKIDCTNSRWTGFPFRIHLSCSPLTIEGLGPSAGSKLTVPTVQFVAQAYDLRRVIALANSALAVGDRSDELLRFTYTKAVAGYTRGEPDELSLYVEDLADGTYFTAGKLNSHFRLERMSPPLTQVALASDAVTFMLPNHGRQTLDAVALEGTIRWNDGPNTVSLLRLRDWSDLAGSSFDLQRVVARSQDIYLEGKGRLALDSDGQLQGKLALMIENLDLLLEQLMVTGVLSKDETEAGSSLLSFLGGENRRVKLDLKIEHGVVYLGPFKLARIPPLN